MPAADMPPAEVDIDGQVVRRLLASQTPDLAEADIVAFPQGWDNACFRVGKSLVARMPRREVAVPLLQKEARWLPELAPGLPLPVPLPVFVGEPGAGYPWPWALTELVPGRPVGRHALPDPASCARRLADFLVALHRPAPPDAPSNPYRGVPLVERDPVMRERLSSIADLADVAALGSAWADALAATPHEGPLTWIHGDLHPHNLMAVDGGLSGVIDFGDLAAGDPATDVAVAWMLFEPTERVAFRDAYRAGDHLWRRARGWAAALGAAMLANSADNPTMSAVGRRTVEALAAGD